MRRIAAVVCAATAALAVAACGPDPSATATPAQAGQQPTLAPIATSSSGESMATQPGDAAATTFAGGTATSTPRANATPSAPPAPSAPANFPPGVGDTAPDFTLPVATGGEATLSQYRGEKPVVLVFYRAFW